MGTPPEHSLVWEDTGDATICGCEDSQETVPAGRGGDAEAGASLCPCPLSQPLNVPHTLCPHIPRDSYREGSSVPCLRVEVLVLPDALHQLLCDACVQD